MFRIAQIVTTISIILTTVSALSAADKNYQLPEWFDGNRVQAHTRLLNYLWGEKPIFYTAAEGFQQMGANVFTRFTKTGSGDCWWPSKVGAVLPEAENFNMVQKMIDNAHARGMRMIGYYRHMADKSMAEKHPEWLCRTADGGTFMEGGKRPKWLCLNSGFREFIKTRLLEQVDMGIDGFYFDYIHMPGTWLGRPRHISSCCCQNCREKFKKIYGRKMPVKPQRTDPETKLLIDFYNRTLIETFEEWTQAVHQKNPDCVMLVSCTFTPGMHHPAMKGLAEISQSAKTEWNKAIVWPREIPKDVLKPDDDMRWAAGFTYLRGASDDRPPHTWIHSIWTKEEALSAAAANLTYGLIANLSINEDEIPKMSFKPAFDMGNKVSPHLMRTKPMRWAAIHYNEKWRDRLWPDEEKIWKQALWPAYGPFEALCRARLPVNYITDRQLEDGKLNDYKILILPTPTKLTKTQLKQVAQFKTTGGIVLEIDPDIRFHDPDKHDQYVDDFLKQVLKAAPTPPVKVTGGPDHLHAVVWEKTNKKETTITLLNDFTWFELHSRLRKNPQDHPELIKAPPPPVSGVVATLQTNRTPKKVFDAVTGQTFKPIKINNGWQVAVPDFQYMAALVFEW